MYRPGQLHFKGRNPAPAAGRAEKIVPVLVGQGHGYLVFNEIRFREAFSSMKNGKCSFYPLCMEFFQRENSRLDLIMQTWRGND
jgi:hypothetical protein